MRLFRRRVEGGELEDIPDGMLVAQPASGVPRVARSRLASWPAPYELEVRGRPIWRNPWAVGAFIGPAHILSAFLYTALAGGGLAVVISLMRRRLRQTVGSTAQLIATVGANAPAIESPLEHNRFAYAPAIAVGTMLAALGF